MRGFVRGPDAFRALSMPAERVVLHVVKDVGGDCRAFAPIDTGELRDSVREAWSGGLVGRVYVGDPEVNEYWPSVEYGSDPHEIVSHGKWPLRNKETGQVFGRRVNHPGTPEQPFMRPALYRRRELRIE